MIAWDERTDVIVVGSGAAGLTAAIEAARGGASAIVFEKMKVTGGNTRISDSCLAAPGNFIQKKAGIEDSPELLFKDMTAAGLGLNHPHLVRLVAEKANEAIEWTREVLGLEYQDRLDRFGGHSVARCITTRNHIGVDITRAQTVLLKQLGIEIRTCCIMERLITDTGGAVAGIRIRAGHDCREENSGTRKNIRAERGVILASGGFGNDIAFRMLQDPGLTPSVESTNHRGATAEALIAALKIHAVPVHLSRIQLGPWGCADESGYGKGASFASYSVYPFGILVDPATGRRIVNEWSDRRQRCEAIFKAGHVCVGIVDAHGAQKASESLESCLKSGKLKAFGSLSDLAAAFEMPPGQLEETVDAYNRMVRNREPDTFGKPLDRDGQPVEEAPFYAIRLWPKVHYTSGGIGIDSNARVIDLDSRPIPGLFAAGEVCGGIHGAARLGSCSLTECIVFGRIAGRQVLKSAQ